MKNLCVVLFLLSVFPFFLLGQNPYPFGGKQAVSLHLLANRTPAQQFDRDFSRDGLADQTSRPALGFEGRLVYHHFLNEKLKLGFGLFTGVYPVDRGVFISKEFFGGARDLDYRDFPLKDYAVYFGLHTDLAYFFRLGERRFLAVGAGLNWLRFTPLTNFGTSISTADPSGGSQRLYTARIKMGEEPAFLAPEVSLRFYQKLGNSWLVHLGGTGTFTGREPIAGDFTFFGAGGNRTGRFTKQYAHVGADLGVTFVPGMRQEKNVKPPRERRVFSDRQRLGVSLVYTVPPALSIQRGYPAGGELDLTDASSVGVEGRVNYSHRAGKKTGFYAGASVGSYPHNYFLHLTPEFAPFDGKIEISGNTSTYLGLHLGGEYFLNPDKKLFLSVGLGVAVVYFPPSGPEGRGFSFMAAPGVFEVVPETEFYVNPEKKWILAPEISLRAYRRVGRRFLFHLGASGIYSRQRPIVAEQFVFKSATQTLEGAYSKQFAHPAIDFGFSIWLKHAQD